MLQRVARTQSRELFFIVILAICLCTAALTQQIGLSLALGAFVAGLVISESDYAHEALAQLFPLRDSFVALFFVTIGLLIDPRTIFSNVTMLGSSRPRNVPYPEFSIGYNYSPRYERVRLEGAQAQRDLV